MFLNTRISLAGLLFYYVFPIRKKVVLDNIELVFKERLSSKDKKHLAKAFYSHLASTLKELLLVDFYSEKRLNEMFEVKGIEYVLEAKKRGAGCLFLTGHLGNWELSVFIWSRLQSLVGPIHVIRKSIHLKWLEQIIFERLDRYRIQIINKCGAVIQIENAIKKTENIIFPMDQHASLERKKDLAVDFLGTKAGTHTSLAFFSNRCQAPVVPVSFYRVAKHKHVIEFHPVIPWEKHENNKEEIYINTLKYNQVLGELILKHPEQWYWIHRRWKL